MELKELLELCGRATPGPWGLDHTQPDIIDLLDADERTTTVSAYRGHDPDVGVFGDPEGAQNDMLFIASANPAVVSALVRVAMAAEGAQQIYGKLTFPSAIAGALAELRTALTDAPQGALKDKG